MPDENLPQRTLKTSFWVIALFTLVFGLRGQPTIAFGLVIGGGIGLSSLWSLTFAIPRLFRPGAAAARFLLGVITFMKLPIYALVLNFAMASPAVSPFAVFVGAAMVPGVLVLKVLGYQLVQGTAAPSGDESCRSKPVLSK